MFKEKPILGYGPGHINFITGISKYKDKTIISTNSGDMGNAHSGIWELYRNWFNRIALFIFINNYYFL